MIMIDIDEPCPYCKTPGGLRAAVLISERHQEQLDHEPLVHENCIEEIWYHPGFEMDNGIRICCSQCGTQAVLSVGKMVMDCGKPRAEAIPSWVKDHLGELLPIDQVSPLKPPTGGPTFGL
jgi:hypothetical protein